MLLVNGENGQKTISIDYKGDLYAKEREITIIATYNADEYLAPQEGLKVFN